MRFLVFALFMMLTSSAIAQEGQRPAPEVSQEQTSEQPKDPSATQDESADQPAIEVEPVVPEVAPAEPASAEHNKPAAEDRSGHANQDSYLIFGDGWAQWAMALTGIGALLLSGWAVWLLRRTLDATRAAVRSADAAVDVTRELGEAQIRAYLSVGRVGAQMVRHNDDFILHLEIRIINGGQSPANDLDTAYVVKGDLVRDGGRQSIPEGLLAGVDVRVFAKEYKLPVDDVISAERDRGRIIIQGRVWYSPVVGAKRRVRRFLFHIGFPDEGLIMTTAMAVTRPDKGNYGD